MFVKCGGMSSSVMFSSDMSACSRTTGSYSVTGFGMSCGSSEIDRTLPNVYISMNRR